MFTSDQIPGNVVDAALQQALSDIGNNQEHIPVKFHENREQTQAGIWETLINSIAVSAKSWQTCLRTARERGRAWSRKRRG
jgi:hypothetical protein